jgi:hypothetical protein
VQKKRIAGASEWVDPDDAPELTDAFFDNAEVFHGGTFIRRDGECAKSRLLKLGSRVSMMSARASPVGTILRASVANLAEL